MVSDRYTRLNPKRILRLPSLIQRVLRRVIEYPVIPANNRYFRFKHGEGIRIMDEDWDNLVILDACRYDFFSDQNSIEGKLTPVSSLGSTSWEFMQGNFVGRMMHDTVYVTANPYVERLPDDAFFTVENVLEHWDSNLNTVPPTEVLNAAVEAHAQYPNKRLIVHFMQPHLPWLGPTAEQIRKKLDIRGWDKYHAHEGGSASESGVNSWSAVRQGDISERETIQAYRETLDIVLDHTDELLSHLSGKSVITADHGEMLGERITPLTRRRYGHPYGTYTPELRIVPWLEIHSESRRDIVAEEPIGFAKLDEDVVNDRLQALGYAPE